MKRTLVCGAVLALAVAGVSSAQAAPAEFKVTGGGQTLVANQSAGNTLAFNARGNEVDAQGQLQYVDRTAGTGQAQVVRHGIVDCVFVRSFTDRGGQATVGGYFRDTNERFTLDVIDNGEGNGNNDIIEFRDEATMDCSEERDDDDALTVELARGNVQVHKER